MNHIPLPHNPTPPSFQIPYICTEEYDDRPFLLYPVRRDVQEFIFDPNTTLYVYEAETGAKILSFVKASDKATAAFLQTWLFFGLLRDFMGEWFNQGDWIRLDDRKQKVLRHPIS